MKRILFAIITCFCWAEIDNSFKLDQESIDRGSQLSSNCQACHGEAGISNNPIWPIIANQHKKYLIEQIYNIKQGANGSRHNPLMYPFVMNLTDENIEDLASYYAAQDYKGQKAQARPDLSKGEQIWRAGIKSKQVPACQACHGPNGNGLNLANIPRLSGQHSKYIVEQLENMRSKKRIARMMNEIAYKMSDEEISAVANYIQGLNNV